MSEHLSIPMDTIISSISTELPKETGRHDTQKQSVKQESCMLGKTPTPIYRHAAPSGPWPWMDFDEDIPVITPPPDQPADTQSWRGYPQSSFPNWTESQVNRCEMLTACPVGESNVFKVDVFDDGKFGEDGHQMATIKDSFSEAAFWDLLKRPREQKVRVRAVFVKNMTKEVLQMLGTKYDVEPFFFSSSTNWIPSRYQESLLPKQSDHITVVLPFIRVIDRTAAGPIPLRLQPKGQESLPSLQEGMYDQIIDTQSPLYLNSCDKYILQDLLSVHMVRAVQTSTIISYHPKLRSATAEQLHSLINRTGRSVYWQKIFEKSKDPTCLFLCFLWYAMYEWDEVFEILYAHINQLVSTATGDGDNTLHPSFLQEQLALSSENIRETRDLHILQAHLLYYRTLLEDFRKSVLFVQETANPAMQDLSVTDEQRRESTTILKRETDYLLSEIERLESQRMMQVMRLKNVIDLVRFIRFHRLSLPTEPIQAFASVNIDDSKYMKELTIATVKDSAAMKQISYLTMIFLPANFISNVFSMNIVEINPTGGETLTHYIIGAVSLTVFAAWVAVALQVDSAFFPPGSPVWRRVGWPVFYVGNWCLERYNQRFGGKRTTT
ncbi:hypothetical protein J3R83DRAFT_5376 [Lanmaoa asiatica]|nr:hypothetical protein J3R83DRAFT_5376 [Lanmaoa asiatica]